MTARVESGSLIVKYKKCGRTFEVARALNKISCFSKGTRAPCKFFLSDLPCEPPESCMEGIVFLREIE